MAKKLSNYTNKELLEEVAQRGFWVRKFHDSISAQCFKCKNQFLIKWVATQKTYAKKNNWDYWTGKKSDKEFKICNSCLRSFYLNKRQEFLQTITDLRKRNHLRSYVSHKVI